MAVENGKVLGTVGEGVVAVEVVAAAAVVVEELGQGVGNPQDHHLEKGDHVVGWETFLLEPASTRWSKQAGSKAQVQKGVEEGEEILLR